MKILTSLIASSFVLVAGQQIGQYTPEYHPPLLTQSCSKLDGCKTENTSVVMDAAWRWLHKVGNYTGCTENGKWIPELCPDGKTCAQNCAYDGISASEYVNSHGVVTNGDELTLKYSDTFSSRVYLMADESKYKMFHLLNQEFAFDVDTSTLECGMNGAVYLVPMEEDGGMASHPTNKVGAKYGMGYCDSGCPADTFVNGEANFGAPTTGGQYGLCCAELDLWEANKISTVYTSHPMTKSGRYLCEDDVECGLGDNYFKGVTDKSGCGFNSYKNGNHTFYGPGSNFTVDTTKKLTVVTQFITDDHTATGNLVEIRRLYKQDGKVIANSKDAAGADSTTDAYCKTQAWGPDFHLQHGGLVGMGKAMQQGVVLAMSIWADTSSNHMSWLDEGNAGSCSADSGDPAVLQKMGIAVKVSNIRAGDLDSTY